MNKTYQKLNDLFATNDFSTVEIPNQEKIIALRGRPYSLPEAFNTLKAESSDFTVETPQFIEAADILIKLIDRIQNPPAPEPEIEETAQQTVEPVEPVVEIQVPEPVQPPKPTVNTKRIELIAKIDKLKGQFQFFKGKELKEFQDYVSDLEFLLGEEEYAEFKLGGVITRDDYYNSSEFQLGLPLTKENISNLRKIHHIVFGYQRSGEASISNKVAGSYISGYEEGDFNTWIPYIQVGTRISSYERGKRVGNIKFIRFAKTEYESMQKEKASLSTIFGLLKEGDYVQLNFLVANDNDNLRNANLHNDMLMLSVIRDGKTKYQFNVTDSTTPENLARAVQYFESDKEMIRAGVDPEDTFAKGGEVNGNDRMYNFLKDDLEKLENAVKGGDNEEVERFFSYWNYHLKSLKTKTNDRMYNFLKDDLEKLENAVKGGDNEEVERFFSYWNYHLKSLKMSKGGVVGYTRYAHWGKNYSVPIYYEKIMNGKTFHVVRDTIPQGHKGAGRKVWDIVIDGTSVGTSPTLETAKLDVDNWYNEEYAKGGSIQLLNSSDDIEWVLSQHLKGYDVPEFSSFVIEGNEDSPDKIELYEKTEPLHTDHPVAVFVLKEKDGDYVYEKLASGGGVPTRFRLTPYKKREGTEFIETIGERQVIFEGNYNEATLKATELLNSDPIFVQVDITKLGKNILSAKKVAVVTKSGVRKLASGGSVGEYVKGVDLLKTERANNHDEVYNILNEKWKRYKIVNSREFDLETPYSRGWVENGKDVEVRLLKKDGKYYWDWKEIKKKSSGGGVDEIGEPEWTDKIMKQSVDYFSRAKIIPDTEDNIKYLQDALDEEWQDVTYEKAKNVYDTWVRWSKSKSMRAGGGVGNFTDYYLVVNLDERGEYSASVYNPNDESVYEINTEHAHELQEDGFLKYKPDEDLDRLTKHLMNLGVIPNGSQIYSQDDFNENIKEEFASGGAVGGRQLYDVFALNDKTSKYELINQEAGGLTKKHAENIVKAINEGRGENFTKGYSNALMDKQGRRSVKASGGSLKERYNAFVGEYMESQEGKGFPVFVRITGHPAQFVSYHNTKELAQKKADSLNRKNKLAEGGNTSTRHFRYLALEPSEKGLTIYLTDEGKQMLEEEGLTDQNFFDYFDDVQGNSEYMFFNDAGDVGLGLTNAPAITDGYYYEENDGNLTDDGRDDSIVYWYPNYMVTDFLDELREGKVFFVKADKFGGGGKVGEGYISSHGLSFDKVDYHVNVNPKNFEVDVNIDKADSVNQNALNDTDAEWNQHTWGYMVYPKSVEQLYNVLKALKVRVSKERLEHYFKGERYASGGGVKGEFNPSYKTWNPEMHDMVESKTGKKGYISYIIKGSDNEGETNVDMFAITEIDKNHPEKRVEADVWDKRFLFRKDEMRPLNKMAEGGKVRSAAEYNKLVREKENIVKNLTPKQIAEMWNANSNAVKSGDSRAKPMTEEEAKMPHIRGYLRNLLIENELTHAEYERYFSHGGSVGNRWSKELLEPNTAENSTNRIEVQIRKNGVIFDNAFFDVSERERANNWMDEWKIEDGKLKDAPLPFASGGKLEVNWYKIQVKQKHEHDWRDEKFQTGGQHYMFKEAQDLKNKLQKMSSGFNYRVVKVDTFASGGSTATLLDWEVTLERAKDSKKIKIPVEASDEHEAEQKARTQSGLTEGWNFVDAKQFKKGGDVDSGNFYVIMDDGTKAWYNVKRVEDVPNVYFAIGREQQGKVLSVAGEVYVHRANALRPLYKKDGSTPPLMPQYAGMEGRQLKLASGGKIGKFDLCEDVKIINGDTEATREWIGKRGVIKYYYPESSEYLVEESFMGKGLTNVYKEEHLNSLDPRKMFIKKSSGGGVQFETGAITPEVDNLVLYVDTTRKLAETRDKLYEAAVTNPEKMFESFKRFLLNVVLPAYYSEMKEHVKLDEDQVEDFALLYSRDFENWKKEHKLSEGGEIFATGGSIAKKCKRGMKLQTLLFDKKYFTEKQAKKWADKHGFKYGNVDGKDNFWRLQQIDSEEFLKKPYDTKIWTKGIKAVFACPKTKMEQGGNLDKSEPTSGTLSRINQTRLQALGIKDSREFGDKYRKWIDKQVKLAELGNYVGYRLTHDNYIPIVEIIGTEGLQRYTCNDWANIEKSAEPYLVSVIHKAEGGNIGRNTYKAFYKGKQTEVKANSSYEAQKKAAEFFKAKKSYDVTVVITSAGENEVVHSTSEFAEGGEINPTKANVFAYWEAQLNNNDVGDYFDNAGLLDLTKMGEDAQTHFNVATETGETEIEQEIFDWAVEFSEAWEGKLADKKAKGGKVRAKKGTHQFPNTKQGRYAKFMAQKIMKAPEGIETRKMVDIVYKRFPETKNSKSEMRNVQLGYKLLESKGFTREHGKWIFI